MADLISIGWGQPSPSIATHGWKPGAPPPDNVLENLLECRTGNTPLVRIRMFKGTTNETMVLWDKIASVGNISRQMNYLTNRVAMGSSNFVLDNTRFDFSDNQKFSRTFFDMALGFPDNFKYFMQQCDIEFGLDFIGRDKDKFWFNLFSGFVTEKSDNADNRTASFSLGDETKKIFDFKLNESRNGQDLVSLIDPAKTYDKEFSIGHYYGNFEIIVNEATQRDNQILIPCAFIDDKALNADQNIAANVQKESGTITGIGSDSLKLIDTAATFITNSVSVADAVFIEGENRFALVVSIDSETQLTLDRTFHLVGDKYQVFSKFLPTVIGSVFRPLSSAPIKTAGLKVYVWLYRTDFANGTNEEKIWAEIISGPIGVLSKVQLTSDFVHIFHSGDGAKEITVVPVGGTAFDLDWENQYLDDTDENYDPKVSVAQTGIETNPVKQLLDFVNTRVGIPTDEIDIDPSLTFPTTSEKSWDVSANFMQSFGAKSVIMSDRKEESTGLDFINAISEICRGNFFITKGLGVSSTSRIKFRMQIPGNISTLKLDESRIRNLKLSRSVAEVKNIVNTRNFEFGITAKIDIQNNGTFRDTESVDKYGRKAVNIGGKAKDGLAFLYASQSYAVQLSNLYVDQFKEPPAFVSFSVSPLGKINETAGELLLNLSDFVDIDSPGLQIGPSSANELSGIFQLFSETFNIQKFEFNYKGLWAGNLLSLNFDETKQLAVVGQALALETTPLWTVNVTGSAVVRTAGDLFRPNSEWVGRDLIFNGADRAKILSVTDGNNLIIDKSLTHTGVSMDFRVKYFLF